VSCVQDVQKQLDTLMQQFGGLATALTDAQDARYRAQEDRAEERAQANKELAR
jgi:hypothetical protein